MGTNEIQMTIRLDKDFHAQWKALSDDAGQTLAEWKRRAMREKLERGVNGESDISDSEFKARVKEVLEEMLAERDL